MKNEQEILEVTNIQYSKKELAYGALELNINGHIDNEYYETTIVIQCPLDENSENFNNLLKDALVKARARTSRLKEGS
ncbi:hypothetical protein [Olivibacter domesticus]|uniref:Uncharacterized protein n=1 Tax=Olivibacter domesticus TaxID=407022 RepID=A0A1H7KGX3_OLID1|nr:hypothetical protein [Olivibacter domesticus]SEK85774.1 hypothetical protein SAMN05661044_01341 [Olivibacter domesticus]